MRNRFLDGPFAPVTEEVTAFDLPVSGRVPPELDGRYLRNGPNPLGIDDPRYHWFLGAGMVHGVRLRDGRAEWYRNRWVRSREVAAALGDQWHEGPIHAGMDFAPNTHVLAHGGRILATVEAGPLPYALTDELETVGPCDFGGTLPGGFAAHTKLDRSSGDLHAIAYFWGWAHVQHVVVSAEGTVRATTGIAVSDAPMMHDFGLTEHYVVLLDLPVTFSMEAAAAGSRLPYTWNPEHEPRVGLLPRTGGSPVAWFPIDPCFVFHTMNAYEEGERVVIDVCRYERSYDVSRLEGPGPLTLDRWVVDPVAGTVTTTRLDDRPQEFPRIDDRRVGLPHRYGYSVVGSDLVAAVTTAPSETAGTAAPNAIVQHDLLAGTSVAHHLGSAAAAGEAIFVPAAPGAAEDDGYVMAFVEDTARGASELVVLAAQDVAAEPVARIRLPQRVPLGFHGNWVADE